MQTQANTLEKKPRLYAIEFLRVFFVFFIILGHIMERYPEVNTNVLAFFHTKGMQTWFGVEFFFVIGGFFLYKKIVSATNTFELIKKIYTRLIPALIFVFLVCILSGTSKLERFPAILSLTTGLSIPGEATGWGDWYVGVYFWCSLLFIGLFSNNMKQGFLLTGILSYFTLCLKFNAPYDGWMKTYYTIIGNQVIRGVYSMGIGMAAAFLSERFLVADKKGIKFFFTAFEAYALVLVFNYIARTSHNHLNFWEMEIVFVLFLISVAHSAGYISSLLNKVKRIQKISRYSYPVFLGHIPFIKFLLVHQSFGLNGATCSLIVLFVATLIGIFEYHIVEKRIMPWVCKYFQGDKQ